MKIVKKMTAKSDTLFNSLLILENQCSTLDEFK